MLECFSRGVSIRIISDDVSSKFPGADIYYLASKGVPCTMDRNKKFHMHNKFVIIDEVILVTGSFNWTAQAVTSNQENLVVIENETLVKDYLKEFNKLWR